MKLGIAWSKLETLPLLLDGKRVLARRREDLGDDIFEYRRRSPTALIFIRAGDGMEAPVDVTAEVTEQLLDSLAGVVMAAIAQKRGQSRRMREAGQRDPADWQQGHSPIGSLRLKDLEGAGVGGRVLACSVRRVGDPRVWDNLEELQRRAAVDLAAAFHAGLGGAARVPILGERVDTSINPQQVVQTRFAKDYWDWAKAAPRHSVNAEAVIDVVCLGKTVREIAGQRRKRFAWVRKNLVAGLDLYALIKGWVQKPVDTATGNKL